MVFTYRPKKFSAFVQTFLFGGVGFYVIITAAHSGNKILWLAVAALLALTFSAASTLFAAFRSGGKIELDQTGIYVPRSPADSDQVFIAYADIDDMEHRKRRGTHLLDIAFAGGKITIESDGMEKRRAFGALMAALVDAVKATRAQGLVPQDMQQDAPRSTEDAAKPASNAMQSAGHYAAQDPRVEVFDYGFSKKTNLMRVAFVGVGAVFSVLMLVFHSGGVTINGISFGPIGAKVIFLVCAGFNAVQTLRFLRDLFAPSRSILPVALGPDGISAPKRPNDDTAILLDYQGVRKIWRQGKTKLHIKHAQGSLQLTGAAFADKGAFERLARSLEARVEMARQGTV